MRSDPFCLFRDVAFIQSGHQKGGRGRLQPMLVVGTPEMFAKGTTRSFILHYLDGDRAGRCPHLPDFQVPTHGEKIALAPPRNCEI